MIPKLGQFKRISTRHAWRNEPRHFTPWLASPQGLELLRDALEMHLEVAAIEHSVGPFKADLVARRTDTPGEHWVLVENQLERTDHGHLGQLLTYAAGLKATTIVWVADHFTEEHCAALAWLNEMTAGQLAFYGLEIELWQIAGAPPAPKFTVVVRPGEEPRAPRAKASGASADLGELQRRYWQGLNARLVEKNSIVQPPRVHARNWVQCALGRRGSWLCARANSSSRHLTVEFIFCGPAGKTWFRELEAQRPAIEREFGPGLSWQIQHRHKQSCIRLRRPQTDVTDEADWPAQHAWMVETLERFYAVFQPRAEALGGGWADGRSAEDDS